MQHPILQLHVSTNFEYVQVHDTGKRGNRVTHKTSFTNNTHNITVDDMKATPMGTGNNNWCCFWAVFRATCYGKGM